MVLIGAPVLEGPLKACGLLRPMALPCLGHARSDVALSGAVGAAICVRGRARARMLPPDAGDADHAALGLTTVPNRHGSSRGCGQTTGC